MKQYALPKYFNIVIFLMLFSMIAFSLFIRGMWSCYHPVNLSDLNIDRVKSGQIVRFSMNSYVISDYGVDQYLGLKETYFEYVVPLENRFVLVAFYDKDTLECMQNYSEGCGETLMIMGKVTPVEQIHDGVYQLILGEDYDLLKQEFVIFQVTEEELKKKSLWWLWLTGIFASMAFILFWGIGGIYRGKEVPFEDSAQYKEYQFKIQYHLEDYLRREKEKIAVLRQQQALASKKISLFVLVCISGVIIFVVCLENCSENVMLVYPTIFGIILLWKGLGNIGKTFLDMDFEVSKRIAKKFGLQTLPIRIEQTSILIGLLNRRIMDKSKQADDGDGENGQ